MALLEVSGLRAGVDGKEILRGVDLAVEESQLVAVMGPNGSGKTTLALVIAGHPRYEVYGGRVVFRGEDITGLKPHERSLRGIFLALQSPPEVSGVRLINFMLASYNKRLGLRGSLLTVADGSFLSRAKQLASELGLSAALLTRELNVGFSGGERKRAELLQALILKPKLAILDEPDSGLDADGLQKVSRAIKSLLSEGASVVLITHYTRMFKYIEPDVIYVMHGGRIALKGGLELASRIDEAGYEGLFAKSGVAP